MVIEKNDIFENMPVPKAVLKLALPTMMGMLVSVIYNLADTFFVGQLNDPYQVAAVTITMPIFLFLMAFGSIFGIGGGAFISRLLGMKDYESVKKTSSFAFYGGLFVGLVCTILALIFMPNLLNISGASENTYLFAENYLRVIALGAPVIILGFSLGQLIRAEGSAKEAMFGMMLGTVINIILDPILILWAGWGVQGAAIATVIANLISVLYYLRYFKKGSSVLSVSFSYFVFDSKIIGEIFSIGIPASLNSLLMSSSNIVLNNFAVSYGDNVVAAFGVIGRINMLPIFLLIGLAQGAQPLLGYNYASGNIKRMKEAMKFTGMISSGIGSLFAIIFFFTGRSLVRIFIDDANVILLGEQFIRVIILSLPILGILMLITVTFQAIGAARPSLILSVARQGFVFLPVLLIGNYFFGMDGLIFAQPIADIGAVALAIFLFKKIK